jgi:hypothetical protein
MIKYENPEAYRRQLAGTSLTRRQALAALAAPLILGCRATEAFGPGESLSLIRDPGLPTTLIGAGDQHSVANLAARAQTARMVQQVLDADPTAWAFNAGDLTYHGTMQEQRDWYHPTWGPFLKRTLFTLGNHDREANSTGADYYEYTGAQPYYAHSLGQWWRLYVLNTETQAMGGADAGIQTDWLKRDIAANPNVHKLAMWHIPMFSNICAMHRKAMVWPGRAGAWWQLLQQAGAEFVISGHVHRYERFARMLRNGSTSSQGMRQFVIGTGGLNNMPVLSRHPLCQSALVTRGVMRFDLYRDRYEWSFTDTANVVRDRGTQMCRRVLV